MLNFNTDVLPYLTLGSDMKPPAKLRHAFYQASIDHRDRLRAVFGKSYPYYLDLNRPKEREEYREYRRRIYKNKLRSLRRRVIEVLDYIPQADDYAVSYPKEVTQADSLEGYLTSEKFSKDGPAADWFFKHIRKRYVNDPNAVLVILPMEQPLADTERVKPVSMLIDCESVYQFRLNEFAVLESPERVWITGKNGPEKTGRVLLFLDGDSYCVAKQTATAPGVQTSADIDTTVTNWWDITGLTQAQNEAGEDVGVQFLAPLHNCPTMPARKIGKLIEEQAETEVRTVFTAGQTARNSVNGVTYKPVMANDLGEEYYESILADAVPHVEAAQAADSDREVERNFHVASQEWRYAQKLCPDSSNNGGPCNNGRVALRNEKGEITGEMVCPTCKGSGMDASGSAIGLILVTAPQATSLSDEGRPVNMPTPPGGFIPRSIEPLREFAKEYDDEKKQAYETINMQFLMESPINQSGVAKRADREELYRTLIVEGVHLCGLLEFQLRCAACQRKQNDQAPTVLAPVRLSIENSEMTRDELDQAVTKGFDANLRKPLEKKLIAYQTGEDSVYYRRYVAKENLDPFPDLDFEKKLFLQANARATMDVASEQFKALSEMVTMSIMFEGLLNDLIRQDASFLAVDVETQRNKLLAEARKYSGLARPVTIDPKTGLPNRIDTTLAPLVDIKNQNQLH